MICWSLQLANCSENLGDPSLSFFHGGWRTHGKHMETPLISTLLQGKSTFSLVIPPFVRLNSHMLEG